MPPDALELRLSRVTFLGAGLVLLTFVCAQSALAQLAYAQATDVPDSTASPKPDAKEYSLSGTVVNSVTGEPIRRAVVGITGQTTRATLTNDSGHFDFESLAEGRFSVGATKPGFFSEPNTNRALAAVQVGPDTSPLVLKMAPASVIVGQVASRDDQPLEGLQVRLISKQNLGGRMIWVDRQYQAQTDEHGSFRLANLPAGMYYLEVDQSQETTLAQPGIPNGREQVYAKVFYPGVSEFSAAGPLQLRAGQQMEANFTLTAEPIYDISGNAVAHDEIASPLLFSRRSGEGHDFTQNAPVQDGKFQTKLPAGSYNVSGSVSSGTLFSTPGASVVIGSDSADTHIAMAPAASIPVSVRTEWTGGASGRSGAEGYGMSGLTLQLMPSVPALNQSPHWWRPRSADIENIEPGVYTVDVGTQGQWWAKSVQCGGVDLLNEDLTVTGGVQPLAIEVTLRDDAAAVVGTVAPAEQAEQATVLLVQQRNRRNLVKAVIAMEGKFQFLGVPPGDYALLAFGHADELEYEDAEVLKPYLSKAVHVSLQPHGTANVSLNLSPLSR